MLILLDNAFDAAQVIPLLPGTRVAPLCVPMMPSALLKADVGSKRRSGT